MKNFKDGFSDFKKSNNDFGGRPKFGFAGGAGRKSGGPTSGFNKPRSESRGGERFGARGGDRPSGEMFAATCSSCNKSCEVPFRPNGEKPVYCSACFGKMRDDNERGGERSMNREKPAFQSDRSSAQAMPNADHHKELYAIKAQLAKIELQLNRVLEFVNPPSPKVNKTPKEVTPVSEKVEKVIEQAVVETPKKVRKPKVAKVEKVVKSKAVKKVAVKKVAKVVTKKVVKK